MAADRDDVGSQFAQRCREDAGGLHAIDHEPDIALAADLAERGQIDAVAVAVSYVRARDNARACVHFRNECVERKPAVAVLGVADLDAFGFPVFPHPDVGDMLEVGEHDVVAGFEIEAVSGDIEPFGRVLGECDFGGLCA